MKTLTIKLEDAIYDRLITAGTKHYKEEIKNLAYDPTKEDSLPMIPNDETRDEFLEGVMSQAVKTILNTSEVQEVSRIAVEKKQKEIDALDIKTVIT